MLAIPSRLVPQISKSNFDDEANVFLQKFYPDALITPMAVPITYVARHMMGLRVVERHLTEDFSILGQMCFTSGFTEIYDKENDEYKLVKVRYGTMIIDPDTISKRNNGCKNNTIAHECFHWHKHRDYYIAESNHTSDLLIKHRCDYKASSEFAQSKWTDEDWMEWQARGIAPRILMPRDSFITMVERFLNERNVGNNIYKKSDSLNNWLINSLATFFQVSKKSAEIRLEETGCNIF